MLGLLSAMATETIIGIVAIVVIVISVGIIVATAVRNFLLQKKMKAEAEDKNIVEIDVDAQSVDGVEVCNLPNGEIVAITEEDEKEALQTDGIEEEFGDEAPADEEVLQEIDMNDKSIDENAKVASNDIVDAKVEDEGMSELMNKMSGSEE